MPKTTEKAFDQWTEFYRAAPELGKAPMWPAEPLVRAMKGSYIPGIDKNWAGKKVLEVGFGAGNNFVFLGSQGMELYGVEVSKDICEQTAATIKRFGYETDLREGSNRSIPFEDNTFDLIVSWNVIHYENTEANMRAAIKEHARVLKKGGRVLLSTVAPGNKIFDNHEIVGEHRYQIGRDDDFRKGEVFFCLDSPGYIKYYWGEHFDDVQVGRVSDYLFTEMLDWFLVTGVKR
jgi:ubiquinone/menaquinone biosynthesis C-methylase UbiE